MILRRPYAFLIKNFRIIHLILFMLFAFIMYKANNILTFFKDYISNNGNIEVISSEFISYYVLLSMLLIIIISIVIYFLMKYKKKPRLLYIILIIVSFISSILFIYLYNNIRMLETSVQNARTIRLFRDLSRLNFWTLFISSIPIFVRCLGFDIKKFNFSKDVLDLKLDKEDSEEIEVNVELRSDAIKRTGRKTIRELKYYYLENKFIINIILSIFVIIIIMLFPFNRYVVNGDLNEGEILGTNNFNIKIVDSYISERNRISRDNSYIILKTEIKGKINKYKLDLDKLVLEGKNNKYIPSLKYYYYFSDLGMGYRNNILDTEEYKEYLLIYNIKNEDRNDKFILKYIDSDRNIKLSTEILK